MKIRIYFLFLASLSFIPPNICTAQDDCPKNFRIAKQAGYPGVVRININNISTTISNGNVDDLGNNVAGFIYPKTSGKTAVFNSNLMWVGYSMGNMLVGGAYYVSGIMPGKILTDGTPQNPYLSEVRIYRTRPDYKTSNFENEIADKEGTSSNISAQYEKDWNEWPASDGAPFKDVNQNGKFDPQIDIPGVPGADQTLWYVANDFDQNQSMKVSGCKPLGLELQVTVWAYNKPYALGNSIFKKYKLINKTNTKIENMYVALYVDPDIGDAADDFTGCDTTLNLGYAYNGKDVDKIYGISSPAVGFTILQGPFQNNASTGFGIYNQQKYYSSKNLGMNAFYYFKCGASVFPCPALGTNASTYKWYAYFRGLHPNTFDNFQIPDECGGGKTKYALSGDPITKTGWIDGIQLSPGDRYFGMSSGPFNLAPNETQEFVIAEIAAIGKDRFDSIKELKNYTKFITNIYRDSLYRYPEILTIINGTNNSLPIKFSLSQNYPNPFNPETVINYQFSTNSFVILKVYDLLGREVESLVNEFQQAGEYGKTFNGKSLPSGVYFYRLCTNNYVETRKMILLK